MAEHEDGLALLFNIHLANTWVIKIQLPNIHRQPNEQVALGVLQEFADAYNGIGLKAIRL
jgi:hypothetical protein